MEDRQKQRQTGRQTADRDRMKHKEEERQRERQKEEGERERDAHLVFLHCIINIVVTNYKLPVTWAQGVHHDQGQGQNKVGC